MKYLLLALLGIVSMSNALFGSLPSKDKGIYVYILAKDVHNADYLDVNDCASARAVKRKIKIQDISVGPFNVSLYTHPGQVHYKIDGGGYLSSDLDADQFEAIFTSNPNKIIRTIHLTPLQ